MHKEIAQARKDAGLSQMEVAKRLHISLRFYQGIEYGDHLNPDQAMQLSRVLNAPALTMTYCKQNCPIGRVSSYEVLNNVDLAPLAVLTKYRQESEEASIAVNKLQILLLNKRSAADCTPAELDQIADCADELLDEAHTIALALLQLSRFVDMPKVYSDHHNKCLSRGYHDTRKPALIKAG